MSLENFNAYRDYIHRARRGDYKNLINIKINKLII